MIEWLERVVAATPGRPDPLPIAEFMQQTTREVAFDPASWTPDRAEQFTTIFDGLAPSWRERANEARDDALEDALDRGGVPTGLGAEVGSGTGIFTSRLATTSSAWSPSTCRSRCCGWRRPRPPRACVPTPLACRCRTPPWTPSCS